MIMQMRWGYSVLHSTHTANRIEKNAVVSGVDLLPTILDLADVIPPNPADLDGESFLDILDGATWTRTSPLNVELAIWRS